MIWSFASVVGVCKCLSIQLQVISTISEHLSLLPQCPLLAAPVQPSSRNITSDTLAAAISTQEPESTFTASPHCCAFFLCLLDYFLFVPYFGCLPSWQVFQCVPFLVHCHCCFWNSHCTWDKYRQVNHIVKTHRNVSTVCF